jgi:hypothetical protein
MTFFNISHGDRFLRKVLKERGIRGAKIDFKDFRIDSKLNAVWKKNWKKVGRDTFKVGLMVPDVTTPIYKGIKSLQIAVCISRGDKTRLIIVRDRISSRQSSNVHEHENDRSKCGSTCSFPSAQKILAPSRAGTVNPVNPTRFFGVLEVHVYGHRREIRK